MNFEEALYYGVGGFGLVLLVTVGLAAFIISKMRNSGR